MKRKELPFLLGIGNKHYVIHPDPESKRALSILVARYTGLTPGCAKTMLNRGKLIVSGDLIVCRQIEYNQ